MRLLFCLVFAVLLTGCMEQSRSVYHATGTINGQPVELEINGLENTVTATPNVNALIQTATAGLKGDIAGVLEKLQEVAAKPQAPAPTLEQLKAVIPQQDNTGLYGGGVTALLLALAAAYSKHKDAENHRRDADEAWNKLVPKNEGKPG